MPTNSDMTPSAENTAKLVVLAAPSGGGKTTICDLLLKRNDNFRVSLSATTRKPREHETDGIHYYFLSDDEFRNGIDEGKFVEHAEVHGKLYGTPHSSIRNLIAEGYTVLFDIDVKGALQLKAQYPEALLIFIHPPSMEILETRLRSRETESEEKINLRLKRMPMEFDLARQFDFQVVNDDLQKAVMEIESLIRNPQQGAEAHVSD